ncbi:MAG: polysaccharide deacetylase family protein [Paludibacteraceae bacterium]|nr:polysaccharide deacetylase family protein [Paludibacteraceae bacterium]
MFIEQVPYLVRLLYRNVLWRKDKKEHSIYLTIDDGPTEENTLWILDMLDYFDVKATFFCIGRNVDEHPELYAEIKRRGHSVGLHGYDHKRGLYKNTDVFFKDIEKGAALIKTNLFRPPHGHITREQAEELGKRYQIVLWDVLSRDYDNDLNGEDVLDIVKKYGRNGSIVVFHDSIKAQENMRYALPNAIKYWKTQGYEFKRIVNS